MLLKLENVYKSYINSGSAFHKHSITEALKGITMGLEQGQILGIVGESGSGKTTLARLVCGLEESDSGSVAWDRRDCQGKRNPAQMVFQNPFNSLNPKLRIEYIIKEALSVGRKIRLNEVNTDDVRSILEDVGLKDIDIKRFPHQFSGGQRQRIGIARALAVEPQVLVCDEVVSALDISVQARIINLLRGINNEYRIAVMFISHDIETVAALAEELIVMKDGRIVESGPASMLINNPEKDYTVKLLDSVPRNPWI